MLISERYFDIANKCATLNRAHHQRSKLKYNPKGAFTHPIFTMFFRTMILFIEFILIDQYGCKYALLLLGIYYTGGYLELT